MVFVFPHSNVQLLISPLILKLLDTQGYLWLLYDLTEVIKLIEETFWPKIFLFSKKFFMSFLPHYCHSFGSIAISNICHPDYLLYPPIPKEWEKWPAETTIFASRFINPSIFYPRVFVFWIPFLISNSKFPWFSWFLFSELLRPCSSWMCLKIKSYAFCLILTVHYGRMPDLLYYRVSHQYHPIYMLDIAIMLGQYWLDTLYLFLFTFFCFKT